MFEYGTLIPVEVIFIRRRGTRENNEGNEPNLGVLYAYIKMSQNHLYNYFIVIKH
jgi:hypothetical protein